MISNDEFDNKLFNYFEENKQVPKKIKDSILEVELKRNKKNKKNKNIIYNFSIRKVAVALISLVIISTSAVFAKDISSFIKKVFTIKDNEGVDTAINNDYIYEILEPVFSTSQNIRIGIEEFLMDDYTLDLNFSVQFNDGTFVSAEDKLYIPDMLITDENNKILCSLDIKNAQNFFKEKGMNSDIQSVLNNSINVGTSLFTDRAIDEHSILFTLNCSACEEKFPQSKKIYITFNTLKLNNYTVNGNWKFELTVPEKFVNRKATFYNVTNCNNKNVYKDSITVEVFETGTKFKMNMYLGDYDYYHSKSEDIRKDSVLDSQYIIQEKSYIENEMGEKYYPAMSAENDCICSLSMDGNLNYNETFNLTKFNETEKLKIVLTTIDNEQIIIDLQK